MRIDAFEQIARSAQCLSVCALAVLVCACGGSTDPSTPSNAGSTIWPSNASELVLLSDGGGFVPTPPTGSECQSGEFKYTLTVASQNFAWEECTTPASGPYTRSSGARALTQAELDSVVRAVLNVTLSTKMGCGADKAALFLSVTTPEGEHHYLDDFYACNRAGTYVDGLDALRQVTASLVD